MALTKLNSNDIGVFISTNTTTPAYKEIVCGTDITLDLSRDVNKRKTKCGTITSTSESEYTISFGGVANLTPTSGSEISAQELAVLADSGDDFLIKLEHRTDPTKYHRSGTGNISSYTEDAPEGDVLGFDISVDLSGTVELTS